MKIRRLTALILVIASVLFTLPVYAAESPAYNDLSKQEPVTQRYVTLAELEDFYTSSSSDAILDPAENNYLYGEVSVSGVAELCHVYMRTFVITDVADASVPGLEALAKRIVSCVKNSSATKYIKCIAKTYNARISRVVSDGSGTQNAVTVKIFIACGEKTEDRQQLINGYIRDIANELSPLSDGERFIRLNELMLDGRFRYDMTYKHRCSAVALVNEGIGVCEEYAGFTSLMLDALGYENSLVTGEVGGIPHIWNLVKVKDRLYHLDILHNGPVDASGKHTQVLRSYLLVSEETVSKTHTVAEQHREKSKEAIYDYVFDGYPTSLEGAVRAGGKSYIITDARSVSAAELTEQYGAEFLRISKNGRTLENEDRAGSGALIEIVVNGEAVVSYSLCLKGDIDGDGDITDVDEELLSEYLLAEDTGRYGDLFVLSSDMDGNGALSIKDLVLLYDKATSASDGQDEQPDQPAEETTDEETSETEAAV